MVMFIKNLNYLIVVKQNGGPRPNNNAHVTDLSEPIREAVLHLQKDLDRITARVRSLEVSTLSQPQVSLKFLDCFFFCLLFSFSSFLILHDDNEYSTLIFPQSSFMGWSYFNDCYTIYIFSNWM